MGANKIDVFNEDVMLGAKFLDCLAEHGTQFHIQLRHLGWGSSRLSQHFKDRLLDPRWNWYLVILLKC